MKSLTSNGSSWRCVATSAGLSMLIAAAGCQTAAFAQAGSTGGSIGKQNKDASGGTDAPAVTPQLRGREARPQDARHSRTGDENSGANRRSPASVSGRWKWSALCPIVGELNGFVTLAQNGSSFTGYYGQTNQWDQGKISNGRVSGNSLTFTRNSYDSSGRSQQWTATTSFSPNGKLRMQGSSATFAGPCTFDGTKL